MAALVRTVFRSRSPRPPIDCDARARARPNLRPSTAILPSARVSKRCASSTMRTCCRRLVARGPLATGGVDQAAADEHRAEQVRVVAADARQVDEQDLAAVHERPRPDRRDPLPHDVADRGIGHERAELVEDGLDRAVALALLGPRPLVVPEGGDERVGDLVDQRLAEGVVGQDARELDDRPGLVHREQGEQGMAEVVLHLGAAEPRPEVLEQLDELARHELGLVG